MISAKQKAVLHIAKSKLGLSDDIYRAVLREQGGAVSSTELTNDGFTKVMRRFEELGFKNTSRRPPRSRSYAQAEPAGLITPEQQQLIREMYAQLGWHEISRQMGFNKRCTRTKRNPDGKSFPQTRSEAIKVIEGLKAMVKRTKEQRG